MSMRNQFTGSVRSKPGIRRPRITKALHAAIGRRNTTYYFSSHLTIESVIDPDTAERYVSIDFGQIPDDHDVVMIERAMIAMASLIRNDEEVAVMHGVFPGESYIYRFRNGIVQFAEAELRPVGNAHWKTLIASDAP